jgi:Domain of unknown function (DUF4760)
MTTAKELQTVRELGSLYILYALVSLGVKMDILGTIPQWITAAVAFFALIAAFRSIESQREIARKRAAMDFFVKTDMDSHTLVQHKNFKKACEKLKEHLSVNKPLEEFFGTDEYNSIRDYLNLHELMGVGINRQVLDDSVCEDFWAGELHRAWRDTKPLIEWIQNLPDEAGTYVELVKVYKRWHASDKYSREDD